MDTDTNGQTKWLLYGSCSAASRAYGKGVPGVKNTGFLKNAIFFFYQNREPDDQGIFRAQPLATAAALTAQATTFTTRRLRTCGRILSFCGRLTKPASA